MDILPFPGCVRTLVGRADMNDSECNDPAFARITVIGITIKIRRCNLLAPSCTWFDPRAMFMTPADSGGRLLRRKVCNSGGGVCVDGARNAASANDNDTARAAIARVFIERGEGRREECFDLTFEGESALRDANATLSKWARTAPKTGGYDKCVFVVTWADGEKYEGRFDLQYRHVGGGNHLGDQMQRFLGAIAGTYTPAHLDNEKGRAFLAERYSAEDRAEASRMLSTRTFA